MRHVIQRLPVAAKINLALAVGPKRLDGFHDVATVLQRIDICDDLELRPAPALEVTGFAEDTLTRRALERLAREAGVKPRWHARLEKQIPVAAGLGGGSADAAAALVLANRTLAAPLPPRELLELAAELGSDVPFFLEPGPKLAEGRGEVLIPLELPQDFWVLVAIERGATKRATADVYARFDKLRAGEGFDERRAAVRTVATSCRRPRDLAGLPPNDLAEAAGGSGLAALLLEAGAFRADLTGAGPSTYGLFHRREQAEAARKRLRSGTRVWITAPVW
jgi:4-diphosphocytidyl-2-C-methyl-D-erythritol kinase